MLNNMSIYIGHMWNAVASFIVQNPVIFGLGVAAIVVTVVLSVHSSQK